MVNANPDTAERIGEIRQALHRVRDLDRIAARIADPQVRERIRGVYVDAVPAIGRLDLAQEKHFERMIAGIRMTLDRSESYEADLDRLAVLIDSAMEGGAPSDAPEEPAPEEAARRALVNARPISARQTRLDVAQSDAAGCDSPKSAAFTPGGL